MSAYFFFYEPLPAQEVALKKEYTTTLLQLTEALLKRQETTAGNSNYGGIWCEHCNVWHTRAAEAVYPFAMAYTITKNSRYLKAAQSAANWLFQQQQANGSWKETPEEWTGTTTDQLLMLLLSYEKIAPLLTNQEKKAWEGAMHKAAGFLYAVMRPEFASINYVATTTATLAKAGIFFGDELYLQRAKELAHRTISKMDEDGFLNGEGGKSHGNKMGVDLGYNMEMSLWGLGLFAKLTSDTTVSNAVKKALQNHLYFIYPDGSLDGSWGIRSNKWTGYGGATSDGCQVLFSLFANDDERYASAAWRNLQFLRTNITGGLLGYGPQHAELFNDPPCIYPTFTKAKNLAMAYAFETKRQRTLAPLPADQERWIKVFPTLDVVEVRTQNFMATITAYRYKDQLAGWKGKYMYRPDGGAMSHLWLKGHGFLQASSPTVYTRPEPMSFPKAPGVLSLTPRIEYTDTAGYFTNLYEFDGRLQTAVLEQNKFSVTVAGELKDKNWLTGGVGYQLNYLVTDSFIEKTVRLIYHDAHPVIRFIEPFVEWKGMQFVKANDSTVFIDAGEHKLKFSVEGGSKLSIGSQKENYWAPYPAFKAFPVQIDAAPAAGTYEKTVRYRLAIAR